MSLIAARLRQQYPKENENVDANVVSLRDELTTQSRLLLLTLCGAALCMLVITCANLANLLLVRSLARQKELSIRISLGANRRYIVRQLLAESMILGIIGGAAAVGLAFAALPLLSRLVPNALPVEQVPPLGCPHVAVCALPYCPHRCRFWNRACYACLAECRSQWTARGRAHRRHRTSSHTLGAGDRRSRHLGCTADIVGTC